jgi:hypothetical protein
MKIKLSFIAVLLAGTVFTFTSCKKSSNDSSGPKLTSKQVASQIALNLSQTLYGGFGGFNAAGGLNAPGSLGLVKTKNGLKVNSTGDPLCGTIADTTINVTVNDNGVTASVKGDIKFAFACTSGVLSGFNITDDLAISESNADLAVNFKLIEDLTIAAQNLAADNPNVTLNGALSMGGNYTNKTGSAKGSGNLNYSYTFKSIVIDSNGSITSGSATFTTSGTGPNGVWNYAGTITFLGNDKATIVINGTSYNVDLQTGTVS